ncbi:unnamed protein product [Clonostachys chloroleuca]|uniref:ASST-domain-containing protein n=1 Tax=Clonostachys chloroleuca TaxID=1926264 RepID=A0AA35M582_9HYPO|nr:unnamed protein product [Clonostachys chloroleuca]
MRGPLVLVLAIQAFQGLGLTAELDLLSSQHLYDWGFYGFYPQQTYKSFDLTAPLFNFLQWDEKCNDGFYMITPKGRLVGSPGPVIFDYKGNLVWTTDEFGQVADLQVQTYNKTNYLTFWKSIEGIYAGFGRGEYLMLDENYQVFRTFRPVGDDLMGDLHEFKVTDEGTVLMTVYAPKKADLSPIGGPEEGWIIDSMFQEVDIETGKLLFHWHASEHVDIDETIRYFAGADDGESPHSGFDFFHINSLDKDEEGNYLVSGRHTKTIHLISREDGKIIWTLGGKKNMFQDLSEGLATDFHYQHHIRMHENNTISLFDNARAERQGPKSPHDYSRGLVIKLDDIKLTATLVQQFWDPQHPKHPDSQGSAQLLEETGGMLVDYGMYPAFTEFGPDGDVLCDVRIAPWVLYRVGAVVSYRGFKGHWVGKPTSHINVYLKPSDGVLYVSWNGDTEVSQWVLQGADWEDVSRERWMNLAARPKDGFETGFDMEEDMPEYVRVAGVAQDGRILKYSSVIKRTYGNARSPDQLLTILKTILTIVKLSILIFVALVILRFKDVVEEWGCCSLTFEMERVGIWEAR